MSAAIKQLILFFFTVGCILYLACGDDSLTDSNRNIRNTDYVASEPFDYEIDVVNHTKLRMNVINGSINLIGVDGLTTVSVAGEKSVGSESMEDAEEHLQFLEVNVLDSGDEILIETDQPDNTFGRSYVVDFDIQIPPDFVLDILTINGSVNINSIGNSIAVSLVNGQIVFGEISGSVTVDIVNGQFEGNIELPLHGIADIDVVNGEIDLGIPQNTSAEFSANISNGSISISNLVLFNEIVTPTSVTGTLGNGDGIIDLDVSNGIIDVGGY